jgi:hypothetical protein
MLCSFFYCEKSVYQSSTAKTKCRKFETNIPRKGIVEIGAEAALFPEKEYINGVAVAVRI